MNDDRQYLQFFTLTAGPFHDLKDPRFVWLGEKQLETLAHLKNGIEQRKGIMLLTGEESSGKSVLVDRLIRMLPEDTVAVILREPNLTATRFEHRMSEQLGLPQVKSREELLGAIKGALEKCYAAGKYVLIAIEDAGTAEDEAIERIRLLSNLETSDGEKLVSILITGDDRLDERLATYELRALQQRVEVRRSTAQLTLVETESYIRHRMIVAGGFLEIFTTGAVARVHRFSGGIPKLIDFMCDHALKRACIEKKRKVDGHMIAAYAREIRATSPLGSHDTGDEKPRSRLALMPLITAASILVVVVSLYLKEQKPHAAPALVAKPPTFSLQFQPRSVAIRDEDFQKLDTAVEYLVAQPNSRIVIKGLPQGPKDSAYEKRLAAARPEAVKEYLVSKGVPMSRVNLVVSATGGKSKLEKKESFPAGRIDVEIHP